MRIKIGAMELHRLFISTLCRACLCLQGRHLVELIVHLIQQRQEGFGGESLLLQQSLSNPDEVVGEVARYDSGQMQHLTLVGRRPEDGTTKLTS